MCCCWLFASSGVERWRRFVETCVSAPSTFVASHIYHTINRIHQIVCWPNTQNQKLARGTAARATRNTKVPIRDAPPLAQGAWVSQAGRGTEPWHTQGVLLASPATGSKPRGEPGTKDQAEESSAELPSQSLVAYQEDKPAVRPCPLHPGQRAGEGTSSRCASKSTSRCWPPGVRAGRGAGGWQGGTRAAAARAGARRAAGKRRGAAPPQRLVARAPPRCACRLRRGGAGRARAQSAACALRR